MKMKMKCLLRAKEKRLEASPQRRQTLETRIAQGVNIGMVIRNKKMEEHDGKMKHDKTRKRRKSGAERELDASLSAKAGFSACSAIALPIEVLDHDCQLFEPLSHLDYTVDVWRQIFREWEAGGAFLWALGNGMGGACGNQG